MAFLKDEEKKVLLDRYVDIEWPADVDDLRCVRCERVAIIHYVSKCQHLFCNDCRGVLSDGGQWKCPKCQEDVTQLDDQDFDMEFKMHKLRIFCPNKKYGCKYDDQLRNIPQHLTACEDTQEAALPMDYTANRIEAVDKQLTKVSAAVGELKEEIRSKSIEQVKKIDDVNCKFNVLTESMNSMEKKSEDRNIKLELAFAEEFRSMKSLLESINQRVEQNESLVQEMRKQMSSDVQEMRTQMASMGQKIETLQLKKSEELKFKKVKTYEWTIKDVAKTILEDKWTFESGTFNFTGYKYDIRAMLLKHEGLAFVCLQFKKDELIDNENGFTTVKYIVKDQSDSLEKQDINRESYLEFVRCLDESKWIFGNFFSYAMLSPPYVDNDCIKMTIVFEPPSIDRSFISNNGILTWRVDHYKEMKEEQLHHHIWSPSFYTSPQGYRVKIRFGIDEKGTIVVFVYFLTGEHDDSLTTDFPHKTTVTLFNQSDPSKKVVKSRQREDVKFYAVLLESSRFIEENGFVKDDSLMYSVVIEPVL